MLIGLSILIMSILTILTIFLGGAFPSTTTKFYDKMDAICETDFGEYLNCDAIEVGFSLDPLIGLITVIIALIALGTIIGIKVVASGLSDPSVRIIMLATTYIGIWTVLSLNSANLINRIEIFGPLIYVGITILYAIGVIQKIAEGGS